MVMDGAEHGEVGSDEIYDKLEEIDNKVERIRSDTHNLSRIASLSSSSQIITELKRLIGKSEIKAAVLHLTKDEVKAGDLATKLHVDSGNLAIYVNPFLEKGYITLAKKGRERYYQHAELVDLIGFESVSEFAALIKSWEEKQQQPGTSNPSPPTEGANVS